MSCLDPPMSPAHPLADLDPVGIIVLVERLRGAREGIRDGGRDDREPAHCSAPAFKFCFTSSGERARL